MSRYQSCFRNYSEQQKLGKCDNARDPPRLVRPSQQKPVAVLLAQVCVSRSQERAGIQVVVSMDKDEKCWFPWPLDGDGVLVVIGIVEIPVRGTGDHLLPTYEVTMV